MNNHMDVATNSLLNARQYCRIHNWKKAFLNYLIHLELVPNNKEELEQEFSYLLSILGDQLENDNQYESLYKCYEQGLIYFPSSSFILNDLGSHLIRLNRPEVALPYLERAVSNNDSILAEKNLITCKMNMLPRWHFYMLNDHLRNEIYHNAIHKAISKTNARVLDIGSGCGLLSFYASQCKDVEKIISIESSAILANISEKALQSCDKIEVICKHSTELNNSIVGLSSLVVTEIFDAGLLGEHVLETLIHAWENLLISSAKVVPACADLFVTGINSNSISNQHKVYQLKNLFLDNLCVLKDCDEPYDVENLKQIDYKVLTNTEKALSISFDNLEQLKSLNEGNETEFSLIAQSDGTLQAFAIWFDLYLNENDKITTNPNENNVTCWEQAIIYLDHVLEVAKDDRIKLKLSCKDGKLTIEFKNSPTSCNKCFRVSQEMVTFLNDSKISDIVEQFSFSKDFNNCKVLDLNYFPLFALRCAKLNYKGEYFFMCSSENEYEFLNFVWRSQGFSPNHVTFTIFRSYNELFEKLKKKSMDIIVINLVSKNGYFNEETFENFTNLSELLKSNGLMVPERIEMVIDLIESENLNFRNRVHDKNLFGFKIADEINKFAISEEWQIQPCFYEHKTLGNTVFKVESFKPKSELTKNKIEIKILRDGLANGVMCWYNIIFSNSLHINTYDSLHYKGYCFIFNAAKKVVTDNIFYINLQQENGLLKISLDV